MAANLTTKKYNRMAFKVFFTALVLLGGIFFLNPIFNFSSNWVFMLDLSGNLLLKQGSEWVEADRRQQKLHPVPLYDRKNVRIFELQMKRDYHSGLEKILGTLAQGRLLIFVFSPENQYTLIAEPTSDFTPMTAKAAQKMSDCHFVVNANFYSSGQQIVGELILEGQKFSNESRASGFFRVINGKPYAGPRSLFSEISGHIDYSCQAFPSVMNNGSIFSYVLSEKLPYKTSWKKKTYRNLIGMRSNGDIVFILSHNRGLLSVREITIIAKKLGLISATLFDGGVALQYAFIHVDQRITFSAFNTVFDAGTKVDEYFVKKMNMSFFQTSPVFIGIKDQ